jgi:hypothetical protein
MGRYEVSVRKSLGRREESEKRKVYIEVKGALGKGEVKEGESPSPDYVRLMAFEVTEPTARYIRSDQNHLLQNS